MGPGDRVKLTVRAKKQFCRSGEDRRRHLVATADQRGIIVEEWKNSNGKSRWVVRWDDEDRPDALWHHRRARYLARSLVVAE